MSDPRNTPDPKVVRFEKPSRINDQLVALCRSPEGPRDRQLIYGDAVTHFATVKDWAYVQSTKDGYCGYVHKSLIGKGPEPTHWVSAPSSTAYLEADMKSPDLGNLAFASQVPVFEETEDFADTDIGFVPRMHLSPLAKRFTDPAQIAEYFLGSPYLWGGNSRWGIDCSGLVQAALLACGIPCPGDSDQQMALGDKTSAPYQRNDLLFWKGHVALVTDPETLIHANAHSMSVSYEPIKDTIARIAAKGDGPVTGHRRLPSFSG